MGQTWALSRYVSACVCVCASLTYVGLQFSNIVFVALRDVVEQSFDLAVAEVVGLLILWVSSAAVDLHGDCKRVLTLQTSLSPLDPQYSV